MRLRVFFRNALIVVSGLVATAAQAEYPDRPIRMIVPWAPGGSTDMTARALAKGAESVLGQPIVIVNAPGASTSLGMTKLAREAPDGYTIGTMSSSAYLFEFSGQQLRYEPVNSFSFISYYGDNLVGVVVAKDSPFRTIADLIAAAKTRRLTYGTAGENTTQSYTGAALSKATGWKMDHIPMNGSAGSLNALLGRQVDFIIETSVWQQFVQNGDFRLLALSTEHRSKRYPDVPTLKEFGINSLRSIQAIVAPKDLPEPIRAKLENAFRRAASDTAFVNLMDRLSMEVVDLPGKNAKEIVEREYQKAKTMADRTPAHGGQSQR